MDSYDKYYEFICRICLSYRSNEKLFCLTDKSGTNGLSNYGQAVQQFANVSIRINDNLPQSMCNTCLCLLKQAIQFKLKCEASDKNLSVLYQQTIESQSNLKETVVDFSLFKDNFPQGFSNRSPEIHIETHEKQKNSLKSQFEQVIVKVDQDKNGIIDESDDNYLSDHFDNDEKEKDVTDNENGDEVLDLIEKNLHRFRFSRSKYVVIRKEIPQRHLRRLRRKEREVKRVKYSPQQRIQKRKQRKVPLKSEKCVCNVCQKVLANKETLKHHMQSHTGFKYICEHCGKGFAINNYLQMHLVTRHGTGQYLQCPQCPFKAAAQFLLTEHIRLHTGERPFACDKCGLTFRRIAGWRNHMVHHKEKTIQCPHCPKKFHKPDQMKRHCNSIHERIYVYMCHKCNTCFANPSTVRKHLLKKHGVPREMQGKIIRIIKGKSTEFSE